MEEASADAQEEAVEETASLLANMNTSIRDINGELTAGEPPWLRSHLEVPFGGVISLTLAVLDFNSEHHHRYQFRLGEEEEPWVDMGSRREITFMDLDPGTYEFTARGRNCQGIWSEIAQPSY